MKKLLVLLLSIILVLGHVKFVNAEDEHVLDREWKDMIQTVLGEGDDWNWKNGTTKVSFSLTKPATSEYDWVFDCGDNETEDTETPGTDAVKVYVKKIVDAGTYDTKYLITFYAGGNKIFAPQNSSELLSGFSLMTCFENIELLDTSNVINMSHMMSSTGREGLVIDLSSWDKTKVKNVSGMFLESFNAYGSTHNTYNLSNWILDTTDGRSMFANSFDMLGDDFTGQLNIICQNWHAKGERSVDEMFYNTTTGLNNNVNFDFSGYSSEADTNVCCIFRENQVPAKHGKIIIPNKTAFYSLSKPNVVEYKDNTSTIFYTQSGSYPHLNGTDFILSYGIKYHLDGGVVTNPTSKIDLGDGSYVIYALEDEFDPTNGYTSLLSDVTKEGYSLVGWKDSNGNPITSLSISMWETNYVDIYAVWKDNSPIHTNDPSSYHVVLNTSVN